MDTLDKIIQQYKKESSNYKVFCEEVEALIIKLLNQTQVKYLQVRSRVKSEISLKNKLEKEGKGYSELKDITDLAGVRIITYYEDTVDVIGDIIRSEFKVDDLNSVDKRKLEADRFGYKSLHFVVEFKDERLKLTELKNFTGMKVEIQIRSILQHAWAEIEHELGYKSEIQVPDEFKRDFFRVAAILETADLDFVRTRNGLEKYKQSVVKSINKNKVLKINKITLNTFISEDENVKRIDKRIADFLFAKTLSEPIDLYTLNKLEFLGISTIEKLKNLIIENEEKIIELAQKWLTKKSRFVKPSILYSGVAIFYLCYLLIGKEELGTIKYFFQKYVFNFDTPIKGKYVTEASDELKEIINIINEKGL